MTHIIPVTFKPNAVDALGNGVRTDIYHRTGKMPDRVKSIALYGLDFNLPSSDLDIVIDELLVDPIDQMICSAKDLAMLTGINPDWVFEVALQKGAKDNVGDTTFDAIQKLLGKEFDKKVYASHQFLVEGGGLIKLEANDIASMLGEKIIYQHAIIPGEQFRKSKKSFFLDLPRMEGEYTPKVKEYNLNGLSDQELLQLSIDSNWALNMDSMIAIRDHFSTPSVIEKRKEVGLGENPTDVELEILAQTWSDHCKHTTFNALIKYDEGDGVIKTIDSIFKNYIVKSTKALQKKLSWIVSTLWDNSGVMEFIKGVKNFCFKCETHNSPSKMDAYGGAITGIVGVNRDPISTGRGAKPVYNVYGFCVGDPFYNGNLVPNIPNDLLLEGVRRGVMDGGNKSGILTAYGLTYFDRGFMVKPGIFVLTGAILPATVCGEPGHEKYLKNGYKIAIGGGRVGKDGIHGVTEASLSYGKHITSQHVQLGDPITQKKLSDFIIEARDEGLFTFIQDLGGGGLSSAVGESATYSNGCILEIDKAPLKYAGLDQWEIVVSESQERELMGVSPEKWDRFKELAELHDVEVTDMGTFKDNKHFQVTYKGKTSAYLDLEFLHNGNPQLKLEAKWITPEKRGLKEPNLEKIVDQGKFLKKMLSRGNICGKEYITRQWDQEVQGSSVIKHLVGVNNDVYSDASVIRPVEGRQEGIAISAGINPALSKIDTYDMSAYCMNEAIMRIIAVGGSLKQIALNDNFVWPSTFKGKPRAKYKLAQLIRANQALHDYSLAFGTPCISGKDSMSMDGKVMGKDGKEHFVSALPTLQYSAAGKIEDTNKCITMDVKEARDLVYVVGRTFDECGGSEFYEMNRRVGLNVPKVDAEESKKLYNAISKAVEEGLIESCHGCYKGGLAVALAQTAFAGGLGLDIDLRNVPRDDDLAYLPDDENTKMHDKILYSESASRFVITVAPENKEKFEKLMKGNCGALVGEVTEAQYLNIKGLKGKVVLNENIHNLKAAWQKPFKHMLYHQEAA